MAEGTGLELNISEGQLRLSNSKTKIERQRWFGHEQRRDGGYIKQRMLTVELPDWRKRGRALRRFTM